MDIRRPGFSLPELVVGLLVMSTLAAMAAPGFSRLLERNRATATFHELTVSLAWARLAAVRMGQPVTLCPTQDGLHCRKDLVWDEGWMAYLDPGRGDHPASVQDVIQHANRSGGSLAVRSSLGRHRIRFQPSGWASGSNISLKVCSRSPSRLMGMVLVNNAGRPRTERTDARISPCPFVP